MELAANMEGPDKIAGAGADDTILRVENLASPRSVFSVFFWVKVQELDYQLSGFNKGSRLNNLTRSRNPGR